MALPTDYEARKAIPLASVLDYFPDAFAAVAALPFEPGIVDDMIVQNFFQRGKPGKTARLAAAALTILQLECGAFAGVRHEPGLAALLTSHADAFAAIAEVIGAGQRQHGTTGWDRAKSQDEESTLLRHFLDRGTIDTDGVRHSAKVAWRALALLQKEIESATPGAPISRGSYDSRLGQKKPGDPVDPVVPAGHWHYHRGPSGGLCEWLPGPASERDADGREASPGP